ncbi:unnamed protein product [Clonostachys solani]|uniref:FAD dependent oxidoreductase domain-containing protein n=1 Tax=Clonostachys solani TaxID=160281 RepID=A0A9N9ZJN7_9HYPO|nr:unnamed protein product [Clonostachys solani]
MSASLPVSDSSLSFWHQTTRSFPYLNNNRDAPVPLASRYAVIGSGISGALTAWELIKNGVKGEDILILEAREAVSGATGRNAGHVRPDAFRGFPSFAARHGPVQAKKIIESERVVLQKVKDFVESNGVDCNFYDTTTIDVCLSTDFADHQSRSLAAFEAAGGDTSHIRIYRGEDAKERTRIPAAICAYEWPAASNHPAKLTHWILNDVLNKGAKLWTHCPVLNVTKHNGEGQASNLRWDLHTTRGITSVDTVIHCTNAHAATLLPELSGFVTPLRSQVHAFVPTAVASAERRFKQTMSLRYSLGHYFSVNQLHRDGTIIIGGSGTRDDGDIDDRMKEEMITFDDSQYSQRIAKNSNREFKTLLLEPNPDKLRPGEGLRHAWTGILGMTPDNVPLIGSIEGLEGQWICAGFNGHGMARIFLCAPGLVKLMLGKPWSETGLPECFQYSTERVDRELNAQLKGKL